MFFSHDLINISLIKQLDASSLRQQTIADNVANINTPGFKKSQVNFEDALKKALGSKNNGLRTSHPRHIPTTLLIAELKPELEQVPGTTMRASRNNVDIDQEMVNMLKNTMHFAATSQIWGARKSIMNTVVGRR